MEHNRSPYRVDVLRLSDVYPEDEQEDTSKKPEKKVPVVDVTGQDDAVGASPAPQAPAVAPGSVAASATTPAATQNPAPTHPPTTQTQSSPETSTPLAPRRPLTQQVKKPSVVQPENALPPLRAPEVAPVPPKKSVATGASHPPNGPPLAMPENTPVLDVLPSTVKQNKTPETPGAVKSLGSLFNTKQTETPAAQTPENGVGVQKEPTEKKRSAEEEALAKIASKANVVAPVEEPKEPPLSIDTMTELPPDIWDSPAPAKEVSKVPSPEPTLPSRPAEPVRAQAAVPPAPVAPATTETKPAAEPVTPPAPVPTPAVVKQAPPEKPVEPVAQAVPESTQPPAQSPEAAIPPAAAAQGWTPVTMTQESAQQEQKEAAAQVVGEPAKKATVEGGNLASLRARIVNQSIKTPDVATNPAGNQNSLPVSTEREKQLVQTDLQVLKEAHKAAAKEPVTPPGQLGLKGRMNEPVSTHVVEDLKKGEGVIETTHAKAIAEVAQNLQNLHQETVATTPEPDPAVEILPDPTAPEPEEKLGVGHEDTTVPGALEQEPPKPVSSLPTIRTFKSDVEETITRNRTSVVDMISSEERRRSTGALPTAPTKKRASLSSYLLLGTSAILLLAGVSAVAWFMMSRSSEEDHTIVGVFAAERQEVYDATDKSRAEIMNELVSIRDAVDGNLGSMTEILILERITEPGSDTVRTVNMHAVDFLRALETRAPAYITRSLNGKLMVGVHETNTNAPFLMLVSDYYENTFAGALEWERTIEEDLAPFFKHGDFSRNVPPPTPVTTDTGSSTAGTSTAPAPIIYEKPPVSEQPSTQLGSFEDMTINNVETRVLRDSTGEVVLLWSIPDGTTLVITSNIRTFESIHNRMTAFNF